MVTGWKPHNDIALSYKKILKLDEDWKKLGLCTNRVPNNIQALPDYFTKFELSFVKTLPMIGPRISKTAITTTATKTRINAYSTKPWPFSLGANNMGFHLLSFLGFL
jgi:hypothetical protein